jgi:ubiquinone/menaquinone biosynthesis C-methylase UbiE
MPYSNHHLVKGGNTKMQTQFVLPLFICLKCKHETKLPICGRCGYEIAKINNIWQLSDMPDIVTDSDGDKYIGYEYIGERYSGSRKYLIEERDALFAEEIAGLTGGGIFLDLACGDGCFTVPCASLGIKIIAGDISNAMLGILQEKAKHNSISLDKVILCRMNALDIPIPNESVDTVVANSMLHLISNPEKVVAEIYRVLKPGGAFICKDDSPGRTIEKSTFDNADYLEISNALYNEYWKSLGEYGIAPKKYSWKFDRNAFCDNLFANKTTRLIERGNAYESPMKDGFLPRFIGRGFSDQVEVPQDIHECVLQKQLNDFKRRYGENFVDTVFKGIEEDIEITVYRK